MAAAKKLPKDELAKYLNMTAEDWDKLSDKKVYEAIEAIVIQLKELEKQVAALEYTFSLLRTTKLDPLFEQYKGAVLQIRSVLLKQSEFMKVPSYKAVLDKLVEKQPKLAGMVKELSEQSKVLQKNLYKGIKDQKPPKKGEEVVKLAVPYSVALEAAEAMVLEAGLIDNLKGLWGKYKSILLQAWSDIKDEFIELLRKILLRHIKILQNMISDFSRTMRSGSETVASNIEIPFAHDSGFTFKGQPIERLIIEAGGEKVLVVAGKVYETTPDALPAPLPRLIAPSLILAGKPRKMVPRKGPQSSYSDVQRDEVLLNKERTKGYNPKVTEGIRLMFENYSDRGDLGERFVDQDWDEDLETGDQLEDPEDIKSKVKRTRKDATV